MDTLDCNNVSVSTEDSAIFTSEKKPQGFACLSKEELTRISQRGGIACHQRGTGRKWTKEEAKKFGSLGGKATRSKVLKSRSNAA